MKLIHRSPLSLALLSLPALASAVLCIRGKEERKVETVYPEAGKKLPCKVEYTRGGETKTLWAATARDGFCEEKATGFLGKLVESGFHCDDAQASYATPSAVKAPETPPETAR